MAIISNVGAKARFIVPEGPYEKEVASKKRPDYFEGLDQKTAEERKQELERLAIRGKALALIRIGSKVAAAEFILGRHVDENDGAVQQIFAIGTPEIIVERLAKQREKEASS